VLFHADDGVTGRELWRTDGTASGTVSVKDINPGPFSAFPPLDPEIFEFATEATYPLLGGAICFPANDGARGVELWQSDGTRAGTTLVKELNPFGDSLSIYASQDARSMTGFAGAVFVNATDGSATSTLWAFETR
jgi:ELWxxDGT repeat protein